MKKILKTVVFLFALAFVCGAGVQADAKVKVKSVAVKSVTGSKKVAYVAKGKKVKLTATVKATPNKAKNKKVTYKSAKKAVAVVSSKGVVKGKKLGKTKVTVQSKKNKKKKAKISIKVVNPVKKVALSKKTAAISVGESAALTAKVTGTKKKNFCKTVRWSSSNKKVATVSAKGAVKAVGIGTATITAKAIDGTGKKASCKVTVATKKTDISAISYRTYYNRNSTDVMFISLNQTKEVAASDIKVMIKKKAEAPYVREIEVEGVTTTNKKDYQICLDEYIASGEYAQVTIAALDGVKTKAQKFIAAQGIEKDYIKGTVSEYLNYDFTDDYGSYIAVKFDSSLPAGLTYNEKEKTIEGIPTAIANNQKCNVTITDEDGRIVKKELNFIIGDAKNIIVKTQEFGKEKTDIILNNEYFSCSFVVVGGSGSYQYQMLDNCGGLFQLDEDDEYFYASSNTLKAGTYYPVIRISDKNDSAIYYDTKVTVVVTQGAEITLTVTNYENAEKTIYFNNIETNYTTDFSQYYDTANKGTEKEILQSGIYDVFYYTHTADGKTKINYLAQNMSITQNASYTYTLGNIGKLSIVLKDADGNDYTGFVSITLCSAKGKTLAWTSGIKTADVFGFEAGSYIIRCYDYYTDELLGTANVSTSLSNASVTVKLNKKNA